VGKKKDLKYSLTYRIKYAHKLINTGKHKHSSPRAHSYLDCHGSFKTASSWFIPKHVDCYFHIAVTTVPDTDGTRPNMLQNQIEPNRAGSNTSLFVHSLPMCGLGQVSYFWNCLIFYKMRTIRPFLIGFYTDTIRLQVKSRALALPHPSYYYCPPPTWGREISHM